MGVLPVMCMVRSELPSIKSSRAFGDCQHVWVEIMSLGMATLGRSDALPFQ